MQKLVTRSALARNIQAFSRSLALPHPQHHRFESAAKAAVVCLRIDSSLAEALRSAAR
jgi:hypothetical protein